MADDDVPGPRTFVEKLNQLFDTVHDPDGEPYSPEYVTAWLRTNGGPTMSTSYLYMLRHGERDNPTKSHIEALARFFGVPPAYFFDDDITARIDAQLDLIGAIREGGVRDIAMRSAALSEDGRRILTDLLGSLESSPTSTGGARRRRRDDEPSALDRSRRDRREAEPDEDPPEP